jgi:hypothetical protein
MNNENDQDVPKPVTPEEVPVADPLSPQPEPLPVIEPPKNKPRKRLLIALIVAIVLLVGGGVAAYFLTMQKETADSAASTEQTTLSKGDDAKAPTLPSVIDTVKGELAGDTIADLDTKELSFAYRLGDNKYLTPPKTSAELVGVKSIVELEASVDAEKVLAETALKGIGFEVNALTSVENDLSGEVSYMQSDQSVCQVMTTPEPVGAVFNTKTNEYDSLSYYLTVICANLEDYQETATTAKPFYDAFAKSAGEYYRDNTVFQAPNIKDSQTAGYKTASISLYGYGAYVGGYAGLFYQTPDKTWSYFLGTQSSLLCSEYDTDDLKKAYLGDECLDGADNNSTVKLTQGAS